MVRPSLRGRPHKVVRTPGGRHVVRRVKFQRGEGKCAWCHAELHGTPTLPRVEMKKLPKSSRRPERPYGGYLCPRCLRIGIFNAVVRGQSS
ncbi:MAG: 50S ribosomal protein L34e [Thermoprotei archaeon]|nr:MAG: 50S ribosomal protein L34e [Thermoprotei archaeon]RLF19860.1 MAG: 50S ribosomal protein L34e [Thermoprotei archaeon]